MRTCLNARRTAVATALAVVVAATIASRIGAAYRRDIRAARTRVAEVSRLASTPGGPVEYASAGEGFDVLVVHGAGGGFDQGMDLAGPLATRGFRVVAMSRFGYLRTPLPCDASPAAQADAHAYLLDALAIPRAAVIGASAGAPSAMQFALRHPDRCSALVLLVPAAYAPRKHGMPSMMTPRYATLLFDSALRSDFLFWLAPRLSRVTMIRSLLATPPAVVETASAKERARVATMLAHILPVSQRRAGLLNDAAVCSSLRRDELERITAPTLVLSAADDLFGTLETARYTAEHIPGARFVAYPDGGHLCVGHFDEALSEIETFLRDSERR